MRILQSGPPVDNDKTNTSRLGNDTLGRKRKQRLRGQTDTKGKVCDAAGKPDSPERSRFSGPERVLTRAGSRTGPGGEPDRPAGLRCRLSRPERVLTSLVTEHTVNSETSPAERITHQTPFRNLLI
eukprot:superscaffoldBa00007392_g22483